MRRCRLGEMSWTMRDCGWSPCVSSAGGLFSLSSSSRGIRVVFSLVALIGDSLSLDSGDSFLESYSGSRSVRGFWVGDDLSASSFSCFLALVARGEEMFSSLALALFNFCRLRAAVARLSAIGDIFADCVLVASCGMLARELKGLFRVSLLESDDSLGKNMGLLLSEGLGFGVSSLEYWNEVGCLLITLKRSFTSKVSAPTPEPLMMLTKFLHTRPVMITGVRLSMSLEYSPNPTNGSSTSTTSLE
ncbi:hypothetical protein OGATHE_005212 [Ogataea polymorpha]|uniref:Uncharacterized protein n=1 Tax=Ogataea polymorpha TaxID=460523 RepID=A0A9P8NWN1_9ASCO|nr:hypothetical protein OGATHE_005212 [Ogataea polymorpha]